MLVAVLADAHAHAEAFDAVLGAACERGVDSVWSLGDMIGRGPDPEHVVARTRERCAVALIGNHDYGAVRDGEAAPSIELARERLSADDLEWLRSRRPAARRGDVQCWHGSPRNPVHEYVGPANAAACLDKQRGWLGLCGHTHLAAAFRAGGRAVRVRVDEPLDLREGKWLLNPGAVGAPVPPRAAWWDSLDAQAADGAFWLELDLEARVATWRRAPYDPAPARRRADALGLVS